MIWRLAGLHSVFQARQGYIGTTFFKKQKQFYFTCLVFCLHAYILHPVSAWYFRKSEKKWEPQELETVKFQTRDQRLRCLLIKVDLSSGSSATFSPYLLHGRAGRPCPLSSALQLRGWAVLSFPHSDSQPFVTLGPRNPLPSSGLHKYQKYTRQTELIQKKKMLI